MIICQPINTPEMILLRIILKKAKEHALKNIISECLKNNQLEEAKRYADELKKTEDAPIIQPNTPHIYPIY